MVGWFEQVGVNDGRVGDLSNGQCHIRTRTGDLGNCAGDPGNGHPDELPHVWPCLVHHHLPSLALPSTKE
ncbi:hypothetical protein chiPu_0013836 [Chiloscyllium punctatum]|uniref:Uncharacterized protein n=1 Tax=Chiloscyllium punctatum TaxID=137246 RepID=A0A401SY97_CHIPU|nr:hypothetical protein [Chiloscyllium punctatum]